ncbi:hypothetical protein EV360DRAFT_50275 [Lentinula raphanica]|nr:hypothetical protein EV360DRAFT_50275 [Lentinula raphanica]
MFSKFNIPAPASASARGECFPGSAPRKSSTHSRFAIPSAPLQSTPTSKSATVNNNSATPSVLTSSLSGHRYSYHSPTLSLQKQNLLEEHPLLPQVKAKDRLRSWSSPYSLLSRNERIATYGLNVVTKGEAAKDMDLAESTKSSYAAGLLRFHQFCDLEKIPHMLRMPASETLVLGFIGHYMGSVSGSTIRSWLSGIRAWHIQHGVPWALDSSQELKVARAGARIAGAHHRRPVRNPITLTHMIALVLNIDFNIPFHCAAWAVACMAFWGCRRLGELTIPKVDGLDPGLHALHSTTINFAHNSDGSTRSVSFHIPWTKTTREQGATVTATGQSGSLKVLCPAQAMRRYLDTNKNVPPSFSLFAYLDNTGHPRNMVKSVFMSFCNSIWAKVSLDNVHGHSFRIGGAVELLLAGVSPEVVAATGGWTSLAFLLYWRRFEEIIPTHISKAYDTLQISRLQDTMKAYQKTHKIPNSSLNVSKSGIDNSDLE